MQSSDTFLKPSFPTQVMMNAGLGSVIVLDNGAHTVKAGYAGEQAPRSVFPCVVGIPRNNGVVLATGDKVSLSASKGGFSSELPSGYHWIHRLLLRLLLLVCANAIVCCKNFFTTHFSPAHTRGSRINNIRGLLVLCLIEVNVTLAVCIVVVSKPSPPRRSALGQSPLKEIC